jgi:hypothetical protein
LPERGSLVPAPSWRLDKGLAEGLAHAHHLAGGLHLGPEDGVHTRELDEREHRFLDAEVRRRHLGVMPCAPATGPTMQRAATLASWMPVALLTNGTVREARGLTSST